MIIDSPWKSIELKHWLKRRNDAQPWAVSPEGGYIARVVGEGVIEYCKTDDQVRRVAGYTGHKDLLHCAVSDMGDIAVGFLQRRIFIIIQLVDGKINTTSLVIDCDYTTDMLLPIRDKRGLAIVMVSYKSNDVEQLGCYRAADGKLLWKYRQALGPTGSTKLLTKVLQWMDNIYTVSCDGISAVNDQGVEVWSKAGSKALGSYPTIAASDSELAVFDGSMLTSYSGRDHSVARTAKVQAPGNRDVHEVVAWIDGNSLLFRIAGDGPGTELLCKYLWNGAGNALKLNKSFAVPRLTACKYVRRNGILICAPLMGDIHLYRVE